MSIEPQLSLLSIFNKNQCLIDISNTIETKILDQKNNKCIIVHSEVFHFLANNPNKINLYFLAIDKCLLLDTDNKGKGRTDFAIISKTEFCIIEIKDTFRNRIAHKKMINEQLEDTLNFFKKQDAINSDQKIILIQCWSYKPLRTATTSKQNYYKYFYVTYNAELLEGNTRSFI